MNELEKKYIEHDGKIVLSGTQAILKLALLQREVDKQNGLDTRGFVSGYRGSPLGGVDQEFVARKHITDDAGITFIPGVNEDLAVGAVQGSQNAGLIGDALHDGVFGFWYGKGPGVDRSGDQFRHVNMFGTSKKGGVIAFAGDDHSRKSSALPHETGPSFAAWNIPSITPSSVEDIMRLGLKAIELSRFTGLWTSMKIVSNIADAYQTADVDLAKWKPTILDDIAHDTEVRWPDNGELQEERIAKVKLPLLHRFCRMNPFNEVTIRAETNETGIIAVGKSYVDLMNAFTSNNINPEDHGISIMKIGMSWPLTDDVVRFAENKKRVIVIEEKSGFVENQLKAKLYDVGAHPWVYGKNVFPATMDFDAYFIAKNVAEIVGFPIDEKVLHGKSSELRMPHYCSGCPHNTGTALPQGGVAMIGIGCHYMAAWMKGRDHRTLVPMGGEGIPWVSQSLYEDREHVFANLGDGTYFHSGYLAIRQAVAANTTITYKILFNSAVAMTGGQPIDGELTVRGLIKQLLAEGVDRNKIALVTDSPAPVPVKKYKYDELMSVQESFQKVKGVSVIIHDKECATEKRRKIKRKIKVAEDLRVEINSDICESCGDCSVKSNCLSIVPTETPLGTKRSIDNDSCNIDLACLDGFCPSFITLPRSTLKKAKGARPEVIPTPDPVITTPLRYNILLSGIGGTGVVSASQMISVAANHDGLNVKAVDITGLAQKYGAVTSEISIGEEPWGQIYPGAANLVLGLDPHVITNHSSMKLIGKDSYVLFNEQPSSASQFLNDRDWKFRVKDAHGIIEEITPDTKIHNVARWAKELLGSKIFVTTMMLGMAYQEGKLPISEEAMEYAIRVNGAAVEDNLLAWKYGRMIANYSILPGGEVDAPPIHAVRMDHIAKYKDQRAADSFNDLVLGHPEDKRELVSHALFRAIAHKDEYEVARSWVEYFRENDVDPGTAHLYLCMPWNRKSGKKTKVSGHIIHLFKLLQHGKRIRGHWYDPFKYTEENKRHFDFACQVFLASSNGDYHFLEKSLDVRGFGSVKLESKNKMWKSLDRKAIIHDVNSENS